MNDFKLSWPLKKISVNQKFGNKAKIYTDLGMLGHEGQDYYATEGTPVYASHDGRVTFAGYDSYHGLGVKIRTEDTYDYQGKEVYFSTLYWHLQSGSLKVTASQQVKKGDLIGLSGNTGLSTGPHLHLAVTPLLRSPNKVDFFPVNYDNGYHGFIDPTPYFPKHLEFTTTLKFGSTGPEVEKVQAFLLRQGFLLPQPFLGLYNEDTMKAVLAFQIKYCKLSWYERYVMRGNTIGPKTLEALNRVHERT